MSEASRNRRRGFYKVSPPARIGPNRQAQRLVAVAAAATAASFIAGASPSARAASIWDDANVNSGTSGATLNWFNNPQAIWSGTGTPSTTDQTQTIQFFDASALTNATGFTQTSNIDGTGAVPLNTLILSGNPNNTLTETISGNSLNFSSGGTLTLSGSAKITYNLNSNIQTGGALSIGGTGAGVFNIGGNITEATPGVGSLIKSAASVVTWSGTNTYTGGTTISGGRIIFANSNAVPSSGTIAIASGAVAQLNFGAGAGTFVSHLTNTSAGILSLNANSSDNLDFTNAGTTFLSSPVSGVIYSGTITPNAQTYRFGGGAIGTSSNYTSWTVSSVLADSGGVTNLIMNSRPGLILTNNNTYSGVTNLNTGNLNVALQISHIANGGVASGIGQSSNAAANLIINNTTLSYTGAGSGSTDRLFTINGTAQIQTNGQNLTFSNTTGAIAFLATNTANLLQFSVNGTISFNPQIPDNTGSAFKTSVTETGNNGAQLQLLNPNNSFTGVTTVGQNGGILTVNHLADGGQPSSIGASPSAAGNLNLRANGQQNSPLNLRYIGTGDSTNRQMTIGLNTNSQYNANTFNFDNEGTGPLIMSGSPVVNIGNNGSAAQDTLAAGLTLTANAASGVNQFNGIVGDTTGSVVQPLGINKLGPGTWSLGNPASPSSTSDTYTGPTNVSAGTLLINASILSSITANANSTVGGSGSTTGAVELKNLSILSPGNSGPGKFTVGSLQLDAGSTTNMDIGGHTLGTQFDNVTITNNTPILTYNGTLQIASFSPYNVAAQAGSYTLFTFTGSSTSDFSAVTVDGFALVDHSGVWTGTNGPASYTFTDATGTLAVTPEPASLAIMLCGGVGLLMRRRRTQRAGGIGTPVT